MKSARRNFRHTTTAFKFITLWAALIFSHSFWKQICILYPRQVLPWILGSQKPWILFFRQLKPWILTPRDPRIPWIEWYSGQCLIRKTGTSSSLVGDSIRGQCLIRLGRVPKNSKMKKLFAKMKRSRRVHNPRYQELYSAPRTKKVVIILQNKKKTSRSRMFFFLAGTIGPEL